MALKLADQLWSRPVSFEAGYSFYGLNMWYEFYTMAVRTFSCFITCSYGTMYLLVQNLKTTQWSFLNSVVNCSNNRSIGWPVLKQASTALVSTQPVQSWQISWPVTTASVLTNRKQSNQFWSCPPNWLGNWAITFLRSWIGPACFKAGQLALKWAGLQIGLYSHHRQFCVLNWFECLELPKAMNTAPYYSHKLHRLIGIKTCQPVISGTPGVCTLTELYHS